MSPNAHTTTARRTIELRDGHEIPQLGYGVWQVDDEAAGGLVATAVEAGYRHVDTAAIYRNERGVGEGLRSSGVDPDEVFVTTKLWNDDQGFDSTLRAFEASLELLGLDRVDLYLIHWPSPNVHGEAYLESWKALVRLREEGRARSIGVSNFHPEHLERLVDVTGIAPAINQVELHPYLQQRELRAFHAEHGIATEAWSPLGQGGELLADPVLAGIAEAHDATVAQVVLAWHLHEGNVVIPKSATPSRIRENISLDDVELTAPEVDAIRALDRGATGRIGPDPATAMF